MKQGIHPTYQQAVVTCACGNSWVTRSTRATLHTDVCANCHPFYTGEQRIVDTAGQVERFMRRVEGAQAQPRRKKAERRDLKLEQRRRQDELRRSEEEVELSFGGETAPAPAPRRVATAGDQPADAPVPEQTPAE